MGSDFWTVVYWWTMIFLFGAVGFPLARRLFSSWWDQGYALAKAVGLALGTWGVWILASLHVIPFSQTSILGVGTVLFLFGLYLNSTVSTKRNIQLQRTNTNFLDTKRFPWIFILLEEMFFFGLLLLWAWVKGHEPTIRSLEKFMDFGFTQSILNSRFFPAPDMWYAGEPINYYYFGHTVMAVLTKLSGLSLTYTYNLMLATLFALTASLSLSIAIELIRRGLPAGKSNRFLAVRRMVWIVAGGALTSYVITLGGNLQTLYAFTKGYMGENPPPFWTLLWAPNELHRIGEGITKYWYANATRFIPFTIHEFPSYSFVVSDIHGHVLSLPFVLLAFALLVTFFVFDRKDDKGSWGYWGRLVLYGILGGILFMTNALDGPIYIGLMACIVVVLWWMGHVSIRRALLSLIVVGTGVIAATAPFLIHFTSFVSGIGVNCPPEMLANRKVFMFLFEGADKCQHSPPWMFALLWGFFLYCFVWLYFIRIRRRRSVHSEGFFNLDMFLFLVGIFCLLLLIFPEFFYFKDIYPAHFRSNTMFKLGYQAFIMLGMISGYTIILLTSVLKGIRRTLFWIFLLPQLFLVCIYPYFSVNSYFGNLRTYQTLNGLEWLTEQYPDDDAAISWFNSEFAAGRLINRNPGFSQAPVIVEADGESYTDFERFSAFTGLPTVIGWGVHEWLWRGTYDVVAPRREDVRRIYTSRDSLEVRRLLETYGVSYVIVGSKEREKFPDVNEELLGSLSQVVFRRGTTTVYKIL